MSDSATEVQMEDTVHTQEPGRAVAQEAVQAQPVKGSLLTNERRPNGRNHPRSACQDALAWGQTPDGDAIVRAPRRGGVSPDEAR